MSGAILAEARMELPWAGSSTPSGLPGSDAQRRLRGAFDALSSDLSRDAVMLALLSFNFIGDTFCDLLEPRFSIEAGL